jgi:sorbitol/mannitol transport system substrate-binding protein
MRTRTRAVIGVALANVLLSACAGAGSLATGGDTINVLMVNNPQMVELQKLTAKHFTKKTGIKVQFTTLPENDVRDKIGQDFANQAGQYDVATISNYEAPIYAKNEWLKPLDGYLAEDKGFDQQDILKPIRQSLKGEDGKTYAEPFYGESSFLMYRKDVFEKKNLKMPDKPTWPQIAELAAKADGAEKGMSGICLRGLPGWGEVIAPMTTVVNTYGGTWFDKDYKAKLTDPAFVKAVKFYVNLVRKHGESGATQSGFAECLNNVTQGKSAMWYDATSAAGSLEADKSPVKGKIGYVPAPTLKTKNSGWLYSWAWGLQKASRNQDKAYKFISWASSKEYEELVGSQVGWSKVPAGKRASTYQNPEYVQQASAFAEPTRAAIESADPRNPGVQPRPALGIQFVDIPEFPDLGTQVSQEVSAAIAGQTTVDDALDRGQQLAEDVADRYRSRGSG